MAQADFRSLPPAVIIHGALHLRQALAPCLPVTLLSAPGAAAYTGGLWWRKLIASGENTIVLDILDCGNASGRALEAIRIGQKRIVLRSNAVGFIAICDVARAMGVTIMPQAPPALDLAIYRGGPSSDSWRESQLVAWLRQKDTSARE